MRVNIASRNLLVFRRSQHVNRLLNDLKTAQWEVYIIDNFQQVSQIIKKKTFYVGLCLLEGACSPKELSDLELLLQSYPWINWLMGLPQELTPEGGVNTSESKLTVKYCFDSVKVPIVTKELLITLDQAYRNNEISVPYQSPINDFPSRFGIIGNSPAMSRIFSLLEKVAKEDCSVLIQGETGTGKDLVAEAIHEHSNRAEGPFIAINCGMYTKDLIRAELFGYEKGAFTGAYQKNIGRIEAANGGTLFLDEIGDLPIEQQVNLLRFLEERRIERIGGKQKTAVDVRIIAATHVDLKEAVKKNTFRQDLFYRLQILQVKMPPLRERENDIELLAWYFFNKYSLGRHYKTTGFTPDSIELMKNYPWPGNIRELMNSIRQAVVTSENELLTPTDLGIDRRMSRRKMKTLAEARNVTDRLLISTTLRYSNYNLSFAAKSLGISRVSLYRLIAKYGIRA